MNQVNSKYALMRGTKVLCEISEPQRLNVVTSNAHAPPQDLSVLNTLGNICVGFLKRRWRLIEQQAQNIFRG